MAVSSSMFLLEQIVTRKVEFTKCLLRMLVDSVCRVSRCSGDVISHNSDKEQIPCNICL